MSLSLAVPNVQYLSLESLARVERGGICGPHCQGPKAIKFNNLEISGAAAPQRCSGASLPAGLEESPARAEGPLSHGDVSSRLYGGGAGPGCRGSAGTREHRQNGAHRRASSTGTALPPLGQGKP